MTRHATLAANAKGLVDVAGTRRRIQATLCRRIPQPVQQARLHFHPEPWRDMAGDFGGLVEAALNQAPAVQGDWNDAFGQDLARAPARPRQQCAEHPREHQLVAEFQPRDHGIHGRLVKEQAVHCIE
jgi:hypothetical protein